MGYLHRNPAPGEELREFDTLVGRIKSLPVPWLLNHLALAVTNSVWVDPSEAAAAMAMAATAAGRTIAVCSHGKFGWRQVRISTRRSPEPTSLTRSR